MKNYITVVEKTSERIRSNVIIYNTEIFINLIKKLTLKLHFY